MVVRFEEVRNSDIILVIDENDKYLGKMYLHDFVDCIDNERDPIEENDYLYWFVSQRLINKFLKK